MAAACVFFPGIRDGSEMFRSDWVIFFVKRLEQANGSGTALYKKTLSIIITDPRSWGCLGRAMPGLDRSTRA